eukprot:TRINITY_DN11632_c0_g1_i1.p1 TRINITY_DN11632_c0_g1~~TRINITY_DN11632_c0_g1_i1.p1  ORF type:complete len:428 (+),score=86.40 TRINITY_DN11632_c0_g1_i1:31-1314(+)
MSVNIIEPNGTPIQCFAPTRDSLSDSKMLILTDAGIQSNYLSYHFLIRTEDGEFIANLDKAPDNNVVILRRMFFVFPMMNFIKDPDIQFLMRQLCFDLIETPYPFPKPIFLRLFGISMQLRLYKCDNEQEFLDKYLPKRYKEDKISFDWWKNVTRTYNDYEGSSKDSLLDIFMETYRYTLQLSYMDSKYSIFGCRCFEVEVLDIDYPDRLLWIGGPDVILTDSSGTQIDKALRLWNDLWINLTEDYLYLGRSKNVSRENGMLLKIGAHETKKRRLAMIQDVEDMLISTMEQYEAMRVQYSRRTKKIEKDNSILFMCYLYYSPNGYSWQEIGILLQDNLLTLVEFPKREVIVASIVLSSIQRWEYSSTQFVIYLVNQNETQYRFITRFGKQISDALFVIVQEFIVTLEKESFSYSFNTKSTDSLNNEN